MSSCIGGKYGIVGVVPYFITLKLILPLLHAYSNQTEHIIYIVTSRVYNTLGKGYIVSKGVKS